MMMLVNFNNYRGFLASGKTEYIIEDKTKLLYFVGIQESV